MNAQVPVYEHYEPWGQWSQSPNQLHHLTYNGHFTVSGLPDQNIPPQWHQRHSSFDYGSSWTAQTPMTASESSPTSLSRTASWPKFSSSSTWTSPLTSPQCGLPQVATPTFASTTPYLGRVATPAATAALSARPSYTNYDNGLLTYNAYHSRQEPAAPYPQAEMSRFYLSRPSHSRASPPATFSHRLPQSTTETYNQHNPHLTGLGIEQMQDLTYPVFIKPPSQPPTPPTYPPTPNIATKRSLKLRKRNARRKPNTSSRPKPFRCSFCAFSFDRKCNLTCHLKTHGINGGRVTCREPGCGKEYGRQADVNRHMRTVHHGASFPCESCGKNFGRNDILKRHVEGCPGKKEEDDKNGDMLWEDMHGNRIDGDV